MSRMGCTNCYMGCLGLSSHWRTLDAGVLQLSRTGGEKPCYPSPGSFQSSEQRGSAVCSFSGGVSRAFTERCGELSAYLQRQRVRAAEAEVSQPIR